jgi:phosphohistidine phosphatase SixA
MLIGHNPGLQELALALASAGPELARLKTKFRSRPSD